MTVGHFTLDIHPAELRHLAKRFGEAEDHIRTKAEAVSATPSDPDVAAWTGSAASSIKPEMTALGTMMTQFATRLNTCQTALDTLAGHYEAALNTDLPALNTRWSNAQNDFDDTPKADRDKTDGPNGETSSQTLSRKQGAITADYNTLVTNLQKRTQDCGETLQQSPPVVAFQYYGSTASYGINTDLLLDKLALTKKAAAQVLADAKADAAAIKAMDMNGDLPQSVKDHLKEHAGDSEYATELLNDLGTSGQARLLAWAQFPDYEGGDTWQKAVDARQKQLGELFGAASKNMTFDEHYLDGLQTELEKLTHGMLGPEHGAAQMFIPLMKYGTWDEQDLLTMTDAMMSGDLMRKRWATAAYQVTPDLYEALANNPVAAADAFAKYHQQMYDAMFSQSPEVADAVVTTLQSATIDSRADFPGQSNPAEQNAEWLIEQAADDVKYPWTDAQRLFLADLVNEYRADLAYTVGSPIDPGSVNDPTRPGIEVSTADWMNFLKIPMAENDSMVAVAAVFAKVTHEFKDAYARVNIADQNNGYDEGSTSDAHGWDGYTIGALQSIFINLYNEVGQNRKDDVAEQKEAISKVIDKIFELKDPAGFAIGLGKDALEAFFTSLPSAEKLPPLPGDLDSMRNYADLAITRYSVGSKMGKVPFSTYTSGNHVYTGSPKDYISDSTEDFTRYIENGEMNYDDLKKHPAAWRAFDKWLRDPAIAYNTFPDYSDATVGALRGGSGTH